MAGYREQDRGQRRIDEFEIGLGIAGIEIPSLKHLLPGPEPERIVFCLSVPPDFRDQNVGRQRDAADQKQNIERPTDLPRSATTPPTTLLVSERVTLRAIIWPVDNLPRDTLVPKIVPTIAPICPRIPPPPAAPPGDAVVPATRFCSTS